MTGSNENARAHACKSPQKCFSHLYEYISEMLLGVNCKTSVVKLTLFCFFFLALSKVSLGSFKCFSLNGQVAVQIGVLFLCVVFQYPFQLF